MTGKVIVRQVEPERLPDIQFEGEHRYWDIDIDFNDIFSYVSSQSVLANRRDAEQSVEHIFTKDDNPLVLSYMQDAVANVCEVLARRMPSPAEFLIDRIHFRLEVSENHDDTALQMLVLRIRSYIQKYAYSVWSGKKFDPEEGLDAIRSAMHYRRHGILRKVRNMGF